jgi:hypothetical protein
MSETIWRAKRMPWKAGIFGQIGGFRNLNELLNG